VSLRGGLSPSESHVRAGVVMGTRLFGSLAAVMAVYFLLPVRWDGGDSDLPWLLLDVTLFGVIVAVQVPLIGRSRYPGLRAVEAMALSILIFLVLFARLYLSANASDHAAFSQSLDQITALYFTITVFATVGFGDIVAQTHTTMLLVSVQMLLNLVVLGVVVRLLLIAGQRGVKRKREGREPSA
jgi:voltage-gated potassium channel